MVKLLLLFIGSCLWILGRHVGTTFVQTDWGKETHCVSPTVITKFERDSDLYRVTETPCFLDEFGNLSGKASKKGFKNF